ncbi:tetratricopeptide repeat protein 39C [Diachasma alloeum]|uniref:tetratricopeptide repeat protein 39C n=1 Tax=Diachasma alloeum TaxID=454923 RepID=UPI0007381FA2|nr:tetratricopeptide repeat protein 39C [Diachasma alloeum]
MAATSEPDWSVAKRGLALFLNNKPDEAELLFADRNDSFHVKTARCYMLFMNALMTFEDEKFQLAMKLLKETERECVGDVGWLKSVTNKVFGSTANDDDYARKLEKQIVLADTQVCTAMLVLLQQEVSSYVRGGWMMRKAWRIYQHTYCQILQLYRRTFGINPSGFNGNYMNNENGLLSSRYRSSEWSLGSYHSTTSTSTPILSPSSIKNSLSMIFSLTGMTNEPENNFVEPAEVIRLMSAVSFGYGIFQLCVSLVPPSLLKLIHFLGFEGDRRAGLTALMYARLSEDMRAPLATLSLLCYHTIVRPFCSLHDWNIKSGVDAAKQLISECQQDYQNGALFLFFSGRTERLQSNIDAALVAYDRAMSSSSQREIQLLCLHEVAWCYVIRLNYARAYESFARLQHDSRWCESIYAYLAAVCSGASGESHEVLRTFREINVMISGGGKTTQLDTFVARRAVKLVDQNEGVYTPAYYKLLVYELLYLWNAMPSCSMDSLRNVIAECKNSQNDEPMTGLAYLIAGAAHSYLDEQVTAVKCFKNCLKLRVPNSDNENQHISAFALYELGSTLCKSNSIQEGVSALLKAQSQYSDYDFESRLSVRIHSALKAHSQ